MSPRSRMSLEIVAWSSATDPSSHVAAPPMIPTATTGRIHSSRVSRQYRAAAEMPSPTVTVAGGDSNRIDHIAGAPLLCGDMGALRAAYRQRPSTARRPCTLSGDRTLDRP